MHRCLSQTTRIFLAAIASTIIAPPTIAQVINEDSKILVNDGQTGDQFGHAIATYSGLAVAGANTDDDNGIHSGSAYLFNAGTAIGVHALIVECHPNPKEAWSDGATQLGFEGFEAVGAQVAAIANTR